MKARRVWAISLIVIAVVAVWLLLYRWAAVDGCLDRGGMVLPDNVCSNGEDPPWQLYSLVHPMGLAILGAISIAFVGAPVILWHWIARKVGRRDA